jgi:hypothetical protein
MANRGPATATEVYEAAEQRDPGVEQQAMETAEAVAAQTFQTQLEMGEISKSEYDALMNWLKRTSAVIRKA